MDGLPWPTITAGGGGWLVASWFVWSLLTGRIISKREADVYNDRAERAEAALAKVHDQNAELIATARLSAASIAGLREAHSGGAGDTT